MARWFHRIVIAASLAALGGCADLPKSENYDFAEIAEQREAHRGVIISARRIDVTHLRRGNSKSDLGTGGYIGAGSGIILGSKYGQTWRARLLSTAVGGVAGALIGDKAETVLAAQTAHEYVVEIEKPIKLQQRRYGDGDRRDQAESEAETLFAVIQDDAIPFAIGDRVILITGKAPKVIADSGNRKSPGSFQQRTDAQLDRAPAAGDRAPRDRARMDQSD